MFLTQKQIESISENFVHLYYLLPGISDRPVYKINPVILSEDVLNVKVEYSKLSPDGSVLGVTAFEDINLIYRNSFGDEIMKIKLKNNSIIIDESLFENEELRGRHNFTVAHEAGHIILRRMFSDKYSVDTGKPHFCRKRNQEYVTSLTNAEEWQANALASALLMPNELVSFFFSGFNITKPIRIYNSGKLLKREKKILNAFCEIFGVSRTAALIRLSQLGYVQCRSDEQFLDDYDLDILTGGRI